MLEAGIKGEQSVEVVYENTATAVGSGVLEVFGTPCMLALMEKTASESVAPYLEEGCGSFLLSNCVFGISVCADFIFYPVFFHNTLGKPRYEHHVRKSIAY